MQSPEIGLIFKLKAVHVITKTILPPPQMPTPSIPRLEKQFIKKYAEAMILLKSRQLKEYRKLDQELDILGKKIALLIGERDDGRVWSRLVGSTGI